MNGCMCIGICVVPIPKVYCYCITVPETTSTKSWRFTYILELLLPVERAACRGFPKVANGIWVSICALLMSLRMLRS